MEFEKIHFPTRLNHESHLLDLPLRKMPRTWHLDKPIPLDQAEAKAARDLFLQWWQEHQTFLAAEHADVICCSHVASAPYYAAESAHLIMNQKKS